MSVLLQEQAITTLTPVTEAVATKLEKLGIRTIQDILLHLPHRYEDRTTIVPIAEVALFASCQIQGRIVNAVIRQQRRRSLYCQIDDGSGVMGLRFYHFSPTYAQAFKPDITVRCFGEVRSGASGVEMYHPECTFFKPGQLIPAPESYHRAIYPSTEGLSQLQWQRIMRAALQALTPQSLPDYLDLQTLNLPKLEQALRIIHAPSGDAVAALLAQEHAAWQRLAFEEILAYQLGLLRQRQLIQQRSAPLLDVARAQPLLQRFLKALPFQPTTAQQRTCDEIVADLRQPQPMLRLVQGDVGSGKTLVAAYAALIAIAHEYQVAFMAPTEILAEQHYQTFHTWFTPLDIRTTLLTGKLNRRTKNQRYLEVLNQRAQLIIGTHALLQRPLDFPQLALTVIDEQHRFGVHQRLQLRQKGIANANIPHQLIMTATPIPRTLSMLACADLDLSSIDEMPPGRQPVSTLLVKAQKRELVIQRVAALCTKGQQGYWVCPFIETSETLSKRAAEETFKLLQQRLPNLRIALLHGRLKSTEKEAIMRAFKEHELDLLVATTVIEVGIDVANASCMVIENAENMGLAQLHQLRGRVGRSTMQSYCILLYQSPLSTLARQRLETLRDSTSGFIIAEKDLELRGAGELLGTRQAGLQGFRIADFEHSRALIPQVQTWAQEMLNYPEAQQMGLIHRWGFDNGGGVEA